MKKDITIPEVSGIIVVAIKEFNDVFKCDDWNVYIINKKQVDLEMVIIVSSGNDESSGRCTSKMRRKIDSLPAQSFAKIEYLHPDVVHLENRFDISFFEGNSLFDKRFIFPKGSIKEKSLRMIPLIGKSGIIAR